MRYLLLVFDAVVVNLAVFVSRFVIETVDDDIEERLNEFIEGYWE